MSSPEGSFCVLLEDGTQQFAPIRRNLWPASCLFVKLALSKRDAAMKQEEILDKAFYIDKNVKLNMMQLQDPALFNYRLERLTKPLSCPESNS